MRQGLGGEGMGFDWAGIIQAGAEAAGSIWGGGGDVTYPTYSQPQLVPYYQQESDSLFSMENLLPIAALAVGGFILWKVLR